MNGFALDIRYALRVLRRCPGYALATVVVLALGIGANTAMFSLVNGILLQPLPYTAAERLGMIWHEFGKGAQNLPALHPADYRDYRERSRLFEDFALATSREGILGSA